MDKRVARTTALKCAVDIFGTGNVPEDEILKAAEKFEAWILR